MYWQYRLTATGEMPRSVPFLIIAALGLVYALWTFYGAGLGADIGANETFSLVRSRRNRS